jgi:hypothetical protein
LPTPTINIGQGGITKTFKKIVNGFLDGQDVSIQQKIGGRYRRFKSFRS